MRNTLRVLGFLLVGFVFGDLVSVAVASRNSSGTYSLPSGNPVVTGTTITSSWANTTLSDVSTELTNSLDRGGRGAMTAPLQLTNGTSSLPSVTFGTDTDTGLYRAGAGDTRMQVDAVETQKWVASLVTVPVGLTVTETTANATSVTATGNGTGNGVGGTGGSTSGAGLFGTGGAPNGNGVTAVGTGTASGVNATGGSSNGNGVTAAGDGTGSGVAGTGGSSNGKGVDGTGTGTGSGVKGTGGTTSGLGGNFAGGAPNGNGIAGAGTGSGVGGAFTGGGTGVGVSGTGGGAEAGGSFASGTAATGGTPQSAIKATNGNISLAGTTDPNADVGFTDTVTPKNIIKAWVRYTTNSTASPTVNGAFNVTSVSAAAGAVTVTIADDLAAGNYACTANGASGTILGVDSSSAGTVGITQHNFTTAPSIVLTNPSATTGSIVNVICTGAQ